MATKWIKEINCTQGSNKTINNAAKIAHNFDNHYF